jgi:2-dehydropantoate 2-reductase
MAGKTICVFGAGAIGSLLGGRLALSGAAVSLVARGPHLDAMRERGLRIVSAKGTETVRPYCTDTAAALGVQDYVILTVKAPALRAAAEAVQHLLGPRTVIISAANGVPWWYFHEFPGPLRDHRLAAIDPDGAVERLLPARRTLGCVVHAASEVAEPGVVKARGDEFRLGDPGGALGAELAILSQMMMEAGLTAPVCRDIRHEVWSKLWGNAAFNPLSVLTCAMLDRLAGDSETQLIARQMMVETQQVGERLGIRFPVDVDRRIAMAQAIGPHKTSMLQDLERGRALEIDALLAAVVEMARLVGVATPISELILGLVRQRARIAGCYPG